MVFVKTNLKHQRILLWLTLAMLLVYCYAYYFLLDFWPPPSPTLSADEVVALYAGHNLQFRIGIVLMLVTGAFTTPWSVVVYLQMTRDETGAPTWGVMQALAATIGSWFFFFPVAMWGMCAFTVGRAPELTVLLHECAWLTFVTPISIFPFQIFPTAVVCLSHKQDPDRSAFPRWLGFFSIFAGISGSSGFIAQIFKTGPFAWDGLFPFYLPVILYFSWMVCMFYTLFRAIRLQEQAAQS